MDNKLDPGVKAKWVAALCSGEYEQGTGGLHHTVTMGDREVVTWCCLGVLCDLAVKAEVIPEPLSGDDGFLRYGASKDVGYPPPEVRGWAGFPLRPGQQFTDPDPKVTISREQVQGHDFYDGGVEPVLTMGLAELNDNLQFTFNEIADLIEEQL